MPGVPSFRPGLDRLEPYVPGEQPDDEGPPFVKLNTNENPYPPPDAVLEAIRAAADDRLRLYPEPSARAIRERVAVRFGVESSQVVVGNGSDELLSLLVRAFVAPGDRVVFPWPTYSLYPVLAGMQGGVAVRIPSRADFSLPVEPLVAARSRLLFVCNPNSPTGTWTEADALVELAGRIDGPLVVDEAYADFAGRSLIERIAEAPNLVVVRTLSKSHALAGLRVGYLVAHPAVSAGLHGIRDSYNCDRLAIAGGAAALAADDWLAATVERIAADRGRLVAGLTALGAECVPSAANFVLVRFGEGRAELVLERLRQRRILVRHFDQPGLAEFLRVTVGTTDEVDRFLAAVAEILE